MSLPTDHIDKAALRRRLRERRKAIGTPQRHMASSAVVRHALRQHLLSKGRRIGVYMPAKSEIDVLPLLHRALAMQARCFLPVVPNQGRKRMWFSQWGGESAWVLNRFGIPEYQHPLAKRVRIQHLDLLFMPLLGFDSRGYRLGMGGGYYDASLARLNHRRYWQRPWIVGVAFSSQEVECLPNDPWDIPMNAILTERGYRVFRSARS